jgi:hypothetical protein
MAFSLFHTERNFSQIFRKKQQLLHKTKQIPTSYTTHQRDGITLPQQATFLNAYKELSLSILPSKTKETVFQILNRTIWKQKKAFKSDVAEDALWPLMCENENNGTSSSMVMRITLPIYGI